MNLTNNSLLSLISLEIHKDKKHYIVEDKFSGEFYEMPEICVAAIELINSGETLGRIEQQLKSTYPTEEVDMLDFAEQLLEMQLVSEIDGVKIDIKEQEKQTQGFLWISPKVGKFFFNQITYLIYGVLFIVNLFLVVANPSFFPYYQDLFIFDYMFMNILVWLGISFVLVLIHEFGHVLAMRAFNLPTRLEVGHRLFLVVFETDMGAVWKLPSKDRNVLYIAGLCFDIVILFLALMCQLLFSGSSGIFLSVLSVMVLDTFIRMVYQCCIYMKTDFYYVFENVSGCYNLMENAQYRLRKLVPFLKPAAKEEVTFTDERRTVFIYSIFYVIGVGLTIFLFAIYYIPQLLFAWKKVVPGFSAGIGTLPFWDAAIFTLQILIVLLLLLYSWRKKYLSGSSVSL